MTKDLDQAQVSDFTTKVLSDFGEVLGQAQPHPPGFIISCLNDEWHDVGLVLIAGQHLRDSLERLSGEHAYLVLFVGGPVLEDADQVVDDVLLLIDLADLGDLGGCNPLEQQHFFVGYVDELLPDFLFIGACSGVDVAHEQGRRNPAGEVGLIGSQSHNLRYRTLTIGIIKLLISTSLMPSEILLMEATARSLTTVSSWEHRASRYCSTMVC